MKGKWDSDEEEERAEFHIRKEIRLNEDYDVISASKMRSVDNVANAECKYTPLLENPLFYGCRSVDSYKRLNFIDQGTYGVVFKAKCLLTGDTVALKQVKLNNLVTKVGFPITALRETNILLSLSHPNIIRVREMVVGSSIDKIFMVMDYCENDLKRCMEMSTFSLGETKRIMLQLCSAMEYMHAKWYMHRDLKTSNILYNNKEGVVSICDFGMARKYGSPIEPYTKEVVTLWYRSPEILLGVPCYSIPMDMWSIGCIFGEICTGGKPLFPGQGEADQINRIFSVLGAASEDKWPGANKLPLHSQISYRVPSKSKLRECFPSYIPPGMTSSSTSANQISSLIGLNDTGFDLLSGLLHMNPDKRLTAAQANKHAWYEEDPKPTAPYMMPQFNTR